MAWTFPLAHFEACPENREHSSDGFSIPGRAAPLMLLTSGQMGATLNYLAFTFKEGGEHLYWACPRYGDAFQLDQSEIEAQLIAGVQKDLPARPNAITFLNRILKLPEHLAHRAICHIENSTVKTIYTDNLDLGKSLRSAYSSMGHAVQRELEISFMASRIAGADAGSARDEMMKAFYTKNPPAWVDEATRRGNKIRSERLAAEQAAAASNMDIEFGYS